MMNFLKSFFSGEKSPEELATMSAPKKRDVMEIPVGDKAEEDEKGGGCCGGCGSGGCS